MTLSTELTQLANMQPQRLAVQLHELAAKAKALEDENGTLAQRVDDLLEIGSKGFSTAYMAHINQSTWLRPILLEGEKLFTEMDWEAISESADRHRAISEPTA